MEDDNPPDWRLNVTMDEVSERTWRELDGNFPLYDTFFKNVPENGLGTFRFLASARAPGASRATLAAAFHASVMMDVVRELCAEPTAPCPRCGGEQEIVSSGYNPGYGGTTVYWTVFACGHSEMEESAYSDA